MLFLPGRNKIAQSLVVAGLFFFKMNYFFRRLHGEVFSFYYLARFAISSNLFRYQWLEVCKYVRAVDVLHLRK